MFAKSRVLLSKKNKLQTRPMADMLIYASVGSFITTCAVLTCADRYRISGANQYLIRTGLGIADMKVSKKGFQLPFQKYEFINMNPRNYEFNLHSMSSEKIEFELPGVFTIGPQDDPKSLINYA